MADELLDFQIVQAGGTEELTRLVKIEMEKDWKPLGGSSLNNAWVIQSMYKDIIPDTEEKSDDRTE